MTRQERQSQRKKKSLLYLVENGEYSAGYALLKVEELYDAGKLIDADYDELADYLEGLLNEVERTEDIVEDTAENTTEDTENSAEEPVEEINATENMESEEFKEL